MKRFLKRTIKIAVMACLFLVFFHLNQPPSSLAVPPTCSSYCTSSTPCSTICWDLEEERNSTCGEYGICDDGPDCWSFIFQAGNPFPNPADAGTAIKENMNLLVLGDDSQTYSATLKSKIYNSLSQEIESNNLGTYPSNPDFDVVVWDVPGNQASGVYYIKVRAESDICGTSGWITKTVTILN